MGELFWGKIIMKIYIFDNINNSKHDEKKNSRYTITN